MSDYHEYFINKSPTMKRLRMHRRSLARSPVLTAGDEAGNKISLGLSGKMSPRAILFIGWQMSTHGSPMIR